MGRWLRGAAGMAVALTVLAAGCARREDFYLGELKKTETGAVARSASRIAELESGIRKYRQEVDRKVRASDQLGVYYRMLAVRYMELGMFQQAYEALEEARKIYPENPVLHYYAGMCAARLSLGQAEDAGRGQWLQRAERHYRRAIELDPLHSESIYALAVLLAYELKRPEEAEVLLLRLLEREQKNADALFLLGGLYYGSGRLEQALEAYRRLEGLNLSEDRRRQAGENRKKIEDEMHGSR